MWELALVLVVLVVSFLLRPRGTKAGDLPKEAPGWEEFAQRHQLQYRPVTITGEYRLHHLFIGMRRRYVHDGDHAYYVVETHVQVSVAELPDLVVAYEQAPRIDPDLHLTEGKTEVPLGHQDFDAECFVFVGERAGTEFMRQRGFPETIMELRKRGYVVELRDGALHALRHEFVERGAKLQEDVDEVVAAADVLQGDAHPGTFCTDEHTQRWYWADQRGLEYDTASSMIHGAVEGREVKVHFGDRVPLSAVEASTKTHLDVRTRAPVAGDLGVPPAAAATVNLWANPGEPVHFVDVVRIRSDRRLPLDEVEHRLEAVIKAAQQVEEQGEGSW